MSGPLFPRRALAFRRALAKGQVMLEAIKVGFVHFRALTEIRSIWLFWAKQSDSIADGTAKKSCKH